MNPNQPTDNHTRKTRIAQTAGYYAAFIALGLTSASIGPTLPGLAEHTRSSLSQVSFLFTARSLGYLIGSLRGGRWYDRVPGHRIQILALLGMAAMMALAPTASMLWVLAGVLILLGFAEGTLDVGGNTLLVWAHGEGVGPYMNGLHFFFGIGAFLSPVIIAQAILMTGDISWGYWAIAILLLPVIFLFGRTPAPAIPAHTQEKQTGTSSFGLVVIFMVFFFLNVGAEGSFGGWAFTYARALKLGTEVTAAYLTSAFWGGLTAGRLVSIPIAIRVHPRWILLGDLLCGTASLLLILALPGSFPAALIGAAGAGISMASVFPTTITLAGSYIPISGKITGLFFVGGSLGSMFFPWLIGQLFEPVGPGVAMQIILAAQLGALLVFGLLVAQEKRTAAQSGPSTPE